MEQLGKCELVKNLHTHVETIARSHHLHGSKEDCKDAEQHLYEYIVRHVELFSMDRANGNAWAYSILRNQAVNRLRSVRRTRGREVYAREHDDADWMSEEELSQPEAPPTPEQQYEADELVRRLRKAYRDIYRQLDAKDRRVCRDTRRGIPSWETARVLAVTDARVRQRRAAIRVKLQTAFVV